VPISKQEWKPQRQAKIAAENAADDAQCRNYGAAPGTEAYTECRMMIATGQLSTVITF